MKITIDVPDVLAEEIAAIANKYEFNLTDDEIIEFLKNDMIQVYEDFGSEGIVDSVYAYCHDIKKPTKTAC